MTNDKKTEKQNPYRVFYDDYMDTNACTECTGLMPELDGDEEKWENYLEIFDFRPRIPDSEGNTTDR